MGPIRGVIFDLGSTLIRFHGDWLVVRQRGIQAMLDQLMKYEFGLDGAAFVDAFNEILDASIEERETTHMEQTTLALLRTVMTQFGHSTVTDEVLERALERLYRVSEELWRPMPDLVAVLDDLQTKGFRMGIISNAGDVKNVQRLIDNAEIRHFFDPILISAAVGIRKPHPRIFEVVLKAWGLEGGEVVMVGDMLGADVSGAQRLGLHQIWLTADADNESNRKDSKHVFPEATAENLRDVPDVIERMQSSG
ncbi:MAG: HAD-IA family hydrolase [Anaerolineales bacterium]|nr:HAD-IA family hydrolase [Anaerolineales bacterium]